MISIPVGSFGGNSIITIGQFWGFVGVVLAILIAFYVLRSIGIYTLAKKQRVKRAGLAFVPFVWIYVVCKLIKDGNFFGKSYKKIAFWLCLIFTVAGVLSLAKQFITYFPLFEYAVLNNKIIHIIVEQGEVIQGFQEYIQGSGIFVETGFIPYGAYFNTMNKVLQVLGLIVPLLELASTVIIVFVYISLFKNYWPQHFTIISILCIFLDLFPIFVFVIRKKSPIKYNDYLRARYGQFGSPYGMYGNPYNNPYNQNGQNPNGGFQTTPDHPFEEFAGKGETRPKEGPFSEFDEKDE